MSCRTGVRQEGVDSTIVNDNVVYCLRFSVLFTFLGSSHLSSPAYPPPPLTLYLPPTWGLVQIGEEATWPWPTSSSSKSSSSHSSSNSSSGAPLPAPCMPLIYTGHVWLPVSWQGSRWCSGQRENISPSPAGPPLPQLQLHLWQWLEERGLAGSQTRNGLKNSEPGGSVGAASQQPGSINSPRETDQPATGSSNSSSRRQPAAVTCRSIQAQRQTAHSSHKQHYQPPSQLPVQLQRWRQQQSGNNRNNNTGYNNSEKQGPARRGKCGSHQELTHHLQHLAEFRKWTEQIVAQTRPSKTVHRPFGAHWSCCTGTHQHHHQCPSSFPRTHIKCSVTCVSRTPITRCTISVNFVIIVRSLPLENCDFVLRKN